MSAPEFKTGMRVRLSSLQTATDKNGQEGVLTEWIEEDTRWRINLDDGAQYDIKEQNIRLVDAAVMQPPKPADAPDAPPSMTVEISEVDTESTDGVTYFKVKVFLAEAGTTYTVKKRYNDFCVLKEELERAEVAASAEAPEFPRKHVTGCSGAKLEARKDKLNAWLQATLPSVNCFSELHPRWVTFLQKVPTEDETQ